MSDDPLNHIGFVVVLLLAWLLLGVLPGYLVGRDHAFDGADDAWSCTRWENKPNGDCTQYTRKEPPR